MRVSHESSISFRESGATPLVMMPCMKSLESFHSSSVRVNGITSKPKFSSAALASFIALLTEAETGSNGLSWSMPIFLKGAVLLF